MTNQFANSEAFERLLAAMWDDYTSMNPEARRIHELFTSRGERVMNDHIALRTFGVEAVSVEVLERAFLESGYEEKGRYDFPVKRLRARHYEPPRAGWPKLFISELKVGELSEVAQGIVRRLVSQVDAKTAGRFDFCATGRPWTLRYDDYQVLAAESEYAAWVAAFGFRPNHFTVDIGSLHTLASIEEVNALLESEGFVLNKSGGAIKGTPATLLEQSSVMANVIDVAFDDGVHSIPGCYYEFARRYAGPDGRAYQGFIAASADRIFESTNARETSPSRGG